VIIFEICRIYAKNNTFFSNPSVTATVSSAGRLATCVAWTRRTTRWHSTTVLPRLSLFTDITASTVASGGQMNGAKLVISDSLSSIAHNTNLIDLYYSARFHVDKAFNRGVSVVFPTILSACLMRTATKRRSRNEFRTARSCAR